MNKLKINFIKSVESAKNIEDVQNAINSLPNCFAKGYIVAKYEEFTMGSDDYGLAIEEVIDWASYQIWD